MSERGVVNLCVRADPLTSARGFRDDTMSVRLTSCLSSTRSVLLSSAKSAHLQRAAIIESEANGAAPFHHGIGVSKALSFDNIDVASVLCRTGMNLRIGIRAQ